MDLPLSEDLVSFFRNLNFFNFTRNLEKYGIANDLESLNQAALSIFEELGVLPKRPTHLGNSPKCSFCRSLLRAERKTCTKLGWVFRCRSKSCRKMISPTMNTLFERASLDFLQVLKLIFSYTEGEMVRWVRRHILSSTGTRLAKDTIIEWYKYFNGVCQMMNSVAIESSSKHGAKVSNNIEKLRWDKKFASRAPVGEKLFTFLCHIAAVYRGPFGTPPNVPPNIPFVPTIGAPDYHCSVSTELMSDALDTSV